VDVVSFKLFGDTAHLPVLPAAPIGR